MRCLFDAIVNCVAFHIGIVASVVTSTNRRHTAHAWLNSRSLVFKERGNVRHISPVTVSKWPSKYASMHVGIRDRRLRATYQPRDRSTVDGDWCEMPVPVKSPAKSKLNTTHISQNLRLYYIQPFSISIQLRVTRRFATMGATALLLMDLQEGILDRVKATTEYLERVNEARNAARAAGITVIYATVSFRRGHPEIPRHNVSFAKVASFGGFVEGDAAVAVPSTVAPSGNDVVVTKRRVSAFSGSDLDVILRGIQAENLVLAGVATSGVVLSTLRQAADLDYRLTVLHDLCLDPDPEVHSCLVDKVFPRQAEVVSLDQWVAGLGK